MSTKQLKQDDVKSSAESKQEAYQQKIDWTYNVLITSLGVVTVFAPLYCPPMVFIGGAALAVLAAIRFYDDSKHNAISHWLAKRNGSEEQTATADQQDEPQRKHHIHKHMRIYHHCKKDDAAVELLERKLAGCQPTAIAKVGFFSKSAQTAPIEKSPAAHVVASAKAC